MKSTHYAILALTSALAFTAPALAQPNTPSANPTVLDLREMMKEVTISAQVTAIDPKNRIATLKGPEGNEFAVLVDQRVKNFAQVKVGDMVEATYIQAVALDFQKGDGIRMATQTRAMDRAQAGQLPGGAAMKQTTLVSNIWAIDQAKGTVMVRGPFGHFTEVKVKDPAMLGGVKVGDQMKMTITQAIATSVVRKG
ncbi:hypothetical protein QTH97_33165 [Variovorax sp. J22R24]|uniref:hypothetical protein n=1 Tax=Variovorax gracilis TaxID=3053502 RepID=UPI0025777EC5|nr:hypothetical protein [Variovorax sp. J22R24]MDM0109808.1 hypothetical protein [Variovorax sp. J22R24]